MFPNFSDLLNYLFHIHISLPIQTLGFFIALSFALAYLAFSAEFKRKEAQGLIHAFKRKVIIGEPASMPELVVNATLGFVFGFKIIGAILNYQSFVSDPKGFIFSTRGNVWVGVLCAAGWAYWAYVDRKKQQLPQPKVIEETVHPYQLMVKITFWAGFWGFTGAKLFDTVEHPGYFLHHPVSDLLSPNGFTYYGGYIIGGLAVVYICYKRGIRPLHVLDIGSPGMMLAYAVGRIGCQLSGDGDWGIANLHPKPTWLHWLPNWMWSYNFPHNVANAGVYINGCQGSYCSVLPAGVYPTSFYEVVICLLMFIFLWLIRKHIHTIGLMFFIFITLNGCERFFIEEIRVTIKYNVLGLMLTQAQMISVGMVFIGIAGFILIFLKKIPNR
jgi:phosphatidylglycerol:prolipoprotein diacylglycerol transferase